MMGQKSEDCVGEPHIEKRWWEECSVGTILTFRINRRSERSTSIKFGIAKAWNPFADLTAILTAKRMD